MAIHLIFLSALGAAKVRLSLKKKTILTIHPVVAERFTLAGYARSLSDSEIGHLTEVRIYCCVHISDISVALLCWALKILSVVLK